MKGVPRNGLRLIPRHRDRALLRAPARAVVRPRCKCLHHRRRLSFWVLPATAASTAPPQLSRFLMQQRGALRTCTDAAGHGGERQGVSIPLQSVRYLRLWSVFTRGRHAPFHGRASATRYLCTVGACRHQCIEGGEDYVPLARCCTLAARQGSAVRMGKQSTGDTTLIGGSLETISVQATLGPRVKDV